MKKILIVFLLFLTSCSKENVEIKEPNVSVKFEGFGYCLLGEQMKFSFSVEENKTVKYYTLEGGISNLNYNKIGEVTSQKVNGSKQYDLMIPKKVPPYYFRVNVIYTNGVKETSLPLPLR